MNILHIAYLTLYYHMVIIIADKGQTQCTAVSRVTRREKAEKRSCAQISFQSFLSVSFQALIYNNTEL